MKSLGNRQLSAQDEQQIEMLLNETYCNPKFTAKGYSYPMNDNRLLLDYVIDFFGNEERVRFFRMAYKKNGRWQLSSDFKAVTYVGGKSETVDIDELISIYMGD